MKKSLIESLKDKRVRYGGYAAVITAGVLVGLVVINLLVQQLSVEVDMTESKLFSLTEDTKTMLENLDEDVTIYGIYKTGQEVAEVTEVLNKYEKQSDRVSMELIDVEKNPGFTARFKEEDQDRIREGNLIVEGSDNYRIINAMDLYDFSTTRQGQRQLMGFSTEQRVSSAIQYVTTGFEPVIYELVGHKEYTLSDFGLSSFLQKENYKIKELNLIKSEEVPSDASVLLITSPKRDLNPAEADKIRKYIDNGGKGVFMFDFVSFDFLPEFSKLLQSYGVGIEPGIVMEGNPNNLYTKENPFLLAPNFSDHKIVQPLRENKMSVLIPNCMGVKELEMKKRELEIKPIFQSSEQSWIRTKDSGEREMLPMDIEGPANLAVSIENKFEPEEGLRLVVMGSAGILRSIPPYGQLKGNIEYFLNSLSWVNNQTETVSVGSKSLFKLPLRIPGSLSFIYSGIVVILIPLVIFVVGLIVWLRRRHL
jgi:hypothetical protein